MRASEVGLAEYVKRPETEPSRLVGFLPFPAPQSLILSFFAHAAPFGTASRSTCRVVSMCVLDHRESS